MTNVLEVFVDFFEGPRHWPTLTRRTWLITMPFSLLIWPCAALLIGIVGLVIIPVILIPVWFNSMWYNEPSPFDDLPSDFDLVEYDEDNHERT